MSSSPYQPAMQPYRPGSSDSVDSTARELARLRRAQRSTSSKPRLPNSAIDDGALVTTTNGQTQVVIGEQFDGTNTIAQIRGAKPPQPAGVSMQTVLGGVKLAWTGEFVDPQPGYSSPVHAPMDWAGLTFEVSPSVDFTAGTVQPYDASSAAGGYITVAWGTPGQLLYARAYARTVAGQFSYPSAPFGPVPAGKVTLTDLAFQISDYVGGTKIHYGPDEPAAADISGTGDLWLKEIAPGPPPKYETWRWNGAAWLRVLEQGITQALADALAAQQTADTKARHFSQPDRPANLTAADKGAVWTDTDGGNLRYVWTNEVITSTTRRNLALNPSFAADPPGALAVGKSPTTWSRFQTGTTGAIALDISATGGIGGGQHAHSVAPSMGPTAEMGLIHEIPVTGVTGSVRTSIRGWVTVADTTKPLQLYVDFLNATGSVIASSRITGSGAAGTAATAQTLTSPTTTTATAIPAGAVRMRVWAMRASSSTGANGLPTSASTLTNADLNLDQLLIELDPPAGVGSAYFDGGSGPDSTWDATANASASRTFSSTVSTAAYDWRPALIRSGSFQAKSLIASSVVATGTISAPLLEAFLVLATTVVAGNPNGDHARMTPQGFYVYQDDPVDGIPNEVVRMGTSSNDTIGITSSTGELVASLDQTGSVNARTANFREDITVGGQSLAALRAERGRGLVGRYSKVITGLAGESGLGIRDEYGIAQFTFPVVSGRAYLVQVNGPTWMFTSSGGAYVGQGGSPNGGECALRFREQNGQAVTVGGSRQLRRWLYSGMAEGAWQTPNNTYLFHADYTGTCNFGVSLQLNWSPNVNSAIRVPATVETEPILMEAYDMGVSSLVPPAGNQSNMGGGLYGGPPPPPPPPPQQNYFIELAPAGWNSWRGNNTLRTDVTGPVQGPDPSGYNGIGKGHWWFNVPDITGDITYMEFYAWADHWYLGTGGRGVLNMARKFIPGPDYQPIKANLNIDGWPRPGAMNFPLPADWWEHYTTHPPGGNRADGITVGPTANIASEYGRFNGGSARLKIWYRQ
jgi:hypothetical protein